MVSDAILCPLHNLKTVWNILMILYSYVEQIMTMCRIQEWQHSRSYFLSYFPLIISDAISCPLYNLDTLWNIIMILHSYIEQIMTMCRVQEWQLSLACFFSYFPFMFSDATFCLLHNLITVWNIIMIFHSYVEQVMMICRIQELQLSFSYFLSYLPLMVKATMPSNLNTIRNIFMSLYDSVEEVVTMCLVYKIWRLLCSYARPTPSPPLTPPPPPPQKKKKILDLDALSKFTY